MKRYHFQIVAISFFLSGIVLIAGSGGITGAVIGKPDFNLGSFFGVLLVVSSFFLLIGNKSLEKKVKHLADKLKAREDFVKANYRNYAEFLEKKKLVPREYRYQEKKYARESLSEKTSPPVEYDSGNAIEFIEYFGHSPERSMLPIGEEKHEMKCTINWKIDDPVLQQETIHTSKNDRVWNAANKKIFHLCETGDLGTLDITYKYISGTDENYLYLRHLGSGARILLEKVSDDEYNLVGIVQATQKKREEHKVLNRIRELYKNKKLHR